MPKVSELPAATGKVDVFYGIQDGVSVKLGATPSVDVRWFGAVGNGIANDTAAIKAAIESGASDVHFPDGTYLITELYTTSITVSNVRLTGKATIMCGTAGIALNGSNNTVEGLTIRRATKSVSASMVYVNAGLTLTGSNNKVIDVEVYNMEGPGIILSGDATYLGHNNSVQNCYLHDNITGMLLNPSVRNATIINSRFINNNVNAASGACGILCNRNVTGLKITACDLSGNGEHGFYGQGQNTTITNCNVVGNASDGLKFGSYDTDIHTYAGETLDVWVPGSTGIPGLAGLLGADGYGLKNVIIANNYIADNVGEDGIYFQPSSCEVIVEGNIVKNNNVRWVYFNYTGGAARLEDHFNITIRNNKLTGLVGATPARIEVAAYAGLVMEGNEVAGEMWTYAPNSATAPRLVQTNTGARVANNTADSLSVVRAVGCMVEQNKLRTFDVNASSSLTIVRGNYISGLTTPVDTARISAFSQNNVTVPGDVAFNDSVVAFSFPKEFVGNSIVGNAFDANYFVTCSFGADLPNYGRFSDNYIECTAAIRPVQIEGQYSTISNNTIVGKDPTDFCIDSYGDNLTITGNVCRFGSINLRNDSATIVVANKVASVSGTAGTNIIANNG